MNSPPPDMVQKMRKLCSKLAENPQGGTSAEQRFTEGEGAPEQGPQPLRASGVFSRPFRASIRARLEPRSEPRLEARYPLRAVRGFVPTSGPFREVRTRSRFLGRGLRFRGPGRRSLGARSLKKVSKKSPRSTEPQEGGCDESTFQ